MKNMPKGIEIALLVLLPLLVATNPWYSLQETFPWLRPVFHVAAALLALAGIAYLVCVGLGLCKLHPIFGHEDPDEPAPETRTWKYFSPLIGLLLMTMTTVAVANNLKDNKMPTSENKLFEVLDQSVEAFPFKSLHEPNRVFSTALSETGSNDYFKFYEGSSSFGQIDFRANFAKNPDKQFLSVTLSTPSKITVEEIEAHFNTKAEMRGNSTTHADDGGYWVTFDLPRAELRIGFNQNDEVGLFGLDSSQTP